VGGLEKRSKIITPLEKSTIAHHEAGHASVSWLLEHAHPLVKVTIIPRGKALGAAWYLPEERQITTFEQIFDEMTATMGGRAAEELVFGKVSTGALNDLEKVTKQAQACVMYYGLNKKIGNLSYYDSSGQSEYNFTKPYSDKTAEAIDEEVHKLAEKAYQRALKILSDNVDNLKKLAQRLLDEEVIFSEDVEAIFGPRPFGDNEKHQQAKSISSDYKEKKDYDAKEKVAQEKKAKADAKKKDAPPIPEIANKEEKKEEPKTEE
jgi:cell division protease FtsH